jgi:pilus assembly protein CpaF
VRGNWATDHSEFVENLVATKKNFLVVGPTGSGKTSVIDACLACVKEHERVLILEDTYELKSPNPVSCKMMTRFDPHGVLPEITTHDLLRSALRMRPDRLVIGEIRGAEAKDYLLAVSTGHSGSFSSLHASQASEALLRLEMLIQMAAPQWNLMAIRRLLMLSVDGFLVLSRRQPGRSNFLGYWRLTSLEESGIILEQEI